MICSPNTVAKVLQWLNLRRCSSNGVGIIGIQSTVSIVEVVGVQRTVEMDELECTVPMVLH